MIKDDFGKKLDPIMGLMALFQPTLYICTPEVLEEIYGSKAKCFDKDPGLSFVLKPLLGKSSLVIQGNEHWQKKRKAIS